MTGLARDRLIDLDGQATTPLAAEALAAMRPFLETNHANPHSAHRAARAARAALEAARAEIAALLDVPPAHVILTSGATEANNLALKGYFLGGEAQGGLLTFATEHSCVLETARALARRGVAVTILPVTPEGMPDMAAYRAALAAGGVALVSAMRVNNEVGAIWPTAALAALAHAHGARFHCDAAQAFGKLPCAVGADLGGADMVSLSAHKIHGPKGIGALVVAPDVTLEPLFHGGGQERFRSGTQSPALAAGFGAAARLAREGMAAHAAHARALMALALETLAAAGVRYRINGPDPEGPERIPTNLSVTFPGVPAARLIAAVPGVLFSSGAACSSGAGRPSHVLAALGLDRTAVAQTVRLGWTRETGADDLSAAISAVAKAAARMQNLAA
ncbi:cysteine desulfurase family protein [Thermaurantiacus tibetensis]|uniref:cysteine desulfurase family protein n=1 Tax=Thermaurantiacus tibetensis TaxID=2759035 RepID=UPI001F164324|nr:aminotransferase class V-fold PLP-dependent enzyme [Thermaurantiacus tibetensis]